jgi:hypothetical protein
LALKIEPMIAAKAKEKEYERKTTYQKSEKSSLPSVDATRELATGYGVPPATVRVAGS